jgi:hypothetical protein
MNELLLWCFVVVVWVCLFVCWEFLWSRSGCVAQDNLELAILLPQSLEC